MKLTVNGLRRLIREEYRRVMRESSYTSPEEIDMRLEEIESELAFMDRNDPRMGDLFDERETLMNQLSSVLNGPADNGVMSSRSKSFGATGGSVEGGRLKSAGDIAARWGI